MGHLVRTGRTEEAVSQQRKVAQIEGASEAARRNLVALLVKLAGEKEAAGQGKRACVLGREAGALAPIAAALARFG